MSQSSITSHAAHTSAIARLARVVLAHRRLVVVVWLLDSALDALAGVSIDVPVGQFTAVMGPSGSGESTLMHILAETA